MTLSVVIVSYNVRDYVNQCLQSVMRTRYAGELEIILVDNNSVDGTVEFVKDRFPQVQIIANDRNLGFAPALNRGLQRSTGAYILSLNPDTIVEENTLQVLTDFLMHNPAAGLIGPKILNSDGTFQTAAKRGFPTPWAAFTQFTGLSRLFPHSRFFGRYSLLYLNPDESVQVDAVSGSCMCFTRQVLDKAGLMDEDFFMWGDDLDYCYRVHLAGYEVWYVAATQIMHYKGVTHSSAPYFYMRLRFEAMALFAHKHQALSGGVLARFGIGLAIRWLAIFSYVRNYLYTFSSLIIDAVFITGSFGLMIAVRFLPDPAIRTRDMLLTYIPVVAIYILLWLGVGGILQIYGRYVLSYSRALISSVIGFMLIATLTFIYGEVAYSRQVLILASAMVALLLPGWRMVVHLRQITHKVKDSYRTRRPSIFSRRAAILGTGKEGRRIASSLLRRPDLGIDLIGHIGDPAQAETSAMPGLSILGAPNELREIARRYRLQELIVAGEDFTNQYIMELLEDTRDLGLLFRIVPLRDEVMLGRTDVEHFGDLPMKEVEATLFRRLHLVSKRLFDIGISLVLTTLLLPFWPLLIAGFGLKKLNIWSMNGRRINVHLLKRGNQFIRRLPMLWAILRGRMSLVGGAIISTDEEDPRLLFKPGLTGLNQLRQRVDETEVERGYQYYYLQNQSLTFDLEILLKSLFGI